VSRFRSFDPPAPTSDAAAAAATAAVDDDAPGTDFAFFDEASASLSSTGRFPFVGLASAPDIAAGTAERSTDGAPSLAALVFRSTASKLAAFLRRSSAKFVGVWSTARARIGVVVKVVAKWDRGPRGDPRNRRITFHAKGVPR
jgi:hypothetical protein